MSAVYRKDSLGSVLKHFRVKSRKHTGGLSQGMLADKLFVAQQAVSRIELGLEIPTKEIIAKWVRVTGYEEGWDLYANMNNLHRFALPPIRPELNERFSETLLNMEEQLQEAMRGLEILKSLQNQRIPGKPFEITPPFLSALQDLIDLKPAVKSVFYATERDLKADTEEVFSNWIIQNLTKGRIFTIDDKQTAN